MLGLTIIKKARFKKLIENGLKLSTLRYDLIQIWSEKDKLKRENKDLITNKNFRKGIIIGQDLKIQQLENQLKERNEKKVIKENKELKKLPLLPQTKGCHICKKFYYVTYKKFYLFKYNEFKIGNLEKIYICEDCVKLYKLNSKEK